MNLIYTYSQSGFINNETSICRIIDEKIKETLVIFGVNKKNYIEIYITNTYTGENNLVKKISSISDIDLFVKEINEKQDIIINKEDLFDAEKYILNNICS